MPTQYVTTSQPAKAVPFDNTTNLFTSSNVQAAIEEVNAKISTSFTVSQGLYVDKSGNDTTGTGSIGTPYLTIGKALSVITDSSPTKRYGIFVGPGDYNENLVLKANVFIKGSGPLETRITGTTLNINDTTWNVTSADNRSGFQDVSVNPTCTFDFSAQANNTDGKLYFWNIRTSGAWTCTANTNITQVIMQDSQVFGAVTFVGCNTLIEGTVFNGTAITLNSGTTAGQGAGTLTLASGRTTGNITATYTSNGAITLNLSGIAIGTGTVLTASGASCTVNVNDTSLPQPANRSVSSGATLVRINDNFAKGLISATTNVDVSAATAPTAGQALIATNSTTATWGSVYQLVTTEATATANTNTTSGTDALMDSMTVTPAAGTYLALFNTDINSTAAGAAISVSFYIAGVQVATSLRKIIPFDGGALSATAARGIASMQEILTVTGSQALEVRWSTSGGTATAACRSLITLRVA